MIHFCSFLKKIIFYHRYKKFGNFHTNLKVCNYRQKSRKNYFDFKNRYTVFRNIQTSLNLSISLFLSGNIFVCVLSILAFFSYVWYLLALQYHLYFAPFLSLWIEIYIYSFLPTDIMISVWRFCGIMKMLYLRLLDSFYKKSLLTFESLKIHFKYLYWK